MLLILPENLLCEIQPSLPPSLPHLDMCKQHHLYRSSHPTFCPHNNSKHEYQKETYLHKLCINLEIWRWLIVIERLFPAFVDAVKEVLDCSRNDAHLHLRNGQVEARAHSVRLARTSLKRAEVTQNFRSKFGLPDC